MKWVPCCTTGEDLLGEREGHCAATLSLRASGSEPHLYAVVLGGYCEGEISNTPIVASLSSLPELSWVPLPSQDECECDGATLTAMDGGDGEVMGVLFGGLDADLNRRNAAFSVRLVAAESSASLGAHPSSSPPPPQPHAVAIELMQLQTVGDAPPPVSRHGAGSSNNCLYIFGGETDEREQTNDLHQLSFGSLTWRRIHVGSGSPQPAPRIMTVPLVFHDNSDTFIMYGGCCYVDGQVSSFADVWACQPCHPQIWRKITTTDVNADEGAALLPRCNGHAGGTLPESKRIVFMGGKDTSTGDDRVKVVLPSRDGHPGTWTYTVSLVSPNADDCAPYGTNGEEEEEEEEGSPTGAPHWRYAAAAVVTPNGLLLLAGQCRHPQHPSAYLLSDQ